MEDVCAICMSPSREEDSAKMPGCGHVFHVACIITSAQYDVRCPVCRHVGEGVEEREDKRSETAEVTITQNGLRIRTTSDDANAATSLIEMYEDGMREWRNFTARKRRLLKRRPSLKEKVDRLKVLRKKMKEDYDTMQKRYDDKCNKVWTPDPEISSQRKEISKMRRRELRLSKKIDEEILSELGEGFVSYV